MRPFEYVRARTIGEALGAAASPDAAFIGGGTNLVDLMKLGVARPRYLIDVLAIPELDGVQRLPDGGVRVGAAVRNAALAANVDFAARYPMVTEALLSGASGQLRNAATVGGNLLQRTRCPYFADLASACNKRQPDTGCDAVGGTYDTAAILGWSDRCIATHPSDFCVPLAALDAVIEVVSEAGTREIALADFYRPPHDDPSTDTVLQRGELITAVRLPAEAAAFAGHSRYLKVRDRTSYAFALVSAAAALRLDGGRIADARLALGGVAYRPWRLRAAEEQLRGAPPGDAIFARAADTLIAGARPTGENGFKIALARRAAIRALASASAGTPDCIAALPGSPFTTFAVAGDAG